jgi:hypothetical protein
MRNVIKLLCSFVRLDAVVEESHVKKPLATIKIIINTKIMDFTTFLNGDGFFFSKTSRIKYKTAAKTSAVQ